MLYTTNYIYEKDFRQAIYHHFDEKDFKIINCIQYFCLKFTSSFPSLSRISQITGIPLSTIKKRLPKMYKFNLFMSKQRWSNSSIYKMNPYFVKYAESFAHVMPVLKKYIKLSIDLLFPMNGTLDIKGRYNNTKFDALIFQSNLVQIQEDLQIDHDLQYDHYYFLKNQEKKVEVQRQSVRKATETLGLTDIGIAKCSVLSNQAIEYALSKGPYIFFGRFFDCGVEYSKKNYLPLAWTNFYSYVNNHEIESKPVFMVPPLKVEIKKVGNGHITDDSHKERLSLCRDSRKEYYDKLMVDRPDLYEFALELQSYGFVAGIAKPTEPSTEPFTEPSTELFDDGPPLIPDNRDDEVDYTLTII